MTGPSIAVLRAFSKVAGTLPTGVGQAAAVRRLSNHVNFAPGTHEEQRFAGGGAFSLDLSDRLQRDAFLLRRYEPDVVAFMAQRLAPSGVFLDVGANAGLITFSVGARCGPGVAIHAFEPQPSNIAAWRRNRQLNPDVNAVLIESAVGRDGGELAFASGPPGESGWGYVLDSPSPSADTVINVASVAIDDYATQEGLAFIDLMKVDVEGYEYFVLQGCATLLESGRIGCLVCEINDCLPSRSGISGDELITWLGSFGYLPHAIPPTGARRIRAKHRAEENFAFWR